MRRTSEKSRRYHLIFVDDEEKKKAMEFATKTKGFPSLNSYLLHLLRQDQRSQSPQIIPGPRGEVAEGRRQ